VGLGGVFMTTDGVTWSQLLNTWPRRGRPANCYFDWISQPSNPALYVSFTGRGIVKITGFGSAEAARPSSERHAVAVPNRGTPPTPEEPQPRVRTSDGNTGTTQAMPDNRVLITLDDGRSFVVETDQLMPQNDGTYLI
jgi:hypothetical protein